MKILVLSDSHRVIAPMIAAVEKENPDMIIHLGDHYSDAERLSEEFPDIPMEMVPGNCDLCMAEDERLITVEGKKIFLTHGHHYGVKSSYLALGYAALEKGADVVLFGHTHIPYWDYHNHLVWLNPGSIGSPGPRREPTYGLLLIEGDKVTVTTVLA